MSSSFLLKTCAFHKNGKFSSLIFSHLALKSSIAIFRQNKDKKKKNICQMNDITMNSSIWTTNAGVWAVLNFHIFADYLRLCLILPDTHS